MAIRARVMARDCGLCKTCERIGVTTTASQVDHIVALANGGNNDDDNLEAICDDCHNIKTAIDLGNAAPVVTGLDGWPSVRGYRQPWRIKGYR